MSTAAILEFPPSPARETEPEPFNQHLLNVTFESPAGVRRSAFGGGESVPEAVASARGELPFGTDWFVARWSPVYGE